MPHHHNRSTHGSDRSRRSSTQHESPLEKYRKAIPTLAIGHATKKEWKPSFADELLFLQVAKRFNDRCSDDDRRRQHTLNVPEGPEARLLKQFFKCTYYFLVEAEHLPALGKADAELRRACEVQKAMCSAARSRVENGHALSRKLKELEKKMQAVNSASGNMDQLHGIESELEQIDREALQLRTEVNSRYGELEEALKTPRRLWKENHPDQYQKKSKLTSSAVEGFKERLYTGTLSITALQNSKSQHPA
ncbi:uncharacterized protein FOMMEDRAFT_162344 [Fomitiporia mediterranea MF3/22]|uniref:uncharacterized protein n=1 Tax=Fomitiporia mediterranea (strain MF3/22) TaxID=694068 RepID=UPI000440953B|nr:uncharacterized protein FOMMEDRAFT_162344 [Fomitiporia mediterranea MF3/22]EJC98003.1 hypothetical protein FOMMEDRAFT_162344 [Fomitiporia mediterranea MF3/22]